MKPFKKNLLDLEDLYRRYEEKVKEAKRKPKPGNLVCVKIGGYDRYYLVRAGDQTQSSERIYLGRDKMDLAKALAQQAYERKVNSLVKKRLRQLAYLTRDFQDKEVERLYTELPEGRRKLVDPVELPYDEAVEQWISQEYVSMGFHKDDLLILTEQGERVRSKTEKILADKFYNLGIAYKYECPLALNSEVTVVPDFTFLSPHTRQEIYWEHYGMMDDPSYIRRALRKIATYEKNGIFRGKRLIVTFESSKENLDYDWVDMLIEKYLI